MNHKKTAIQKREDGSAQVTQSRSVLASMARRYNIDSNKLLDTLKNTAFKKATNEQLMALCIVADQYKLNPFTKEIYAFPDKKTGGIVPVVGVDGWLRIINDHPQMDGMDVDGDDNQCTVTIYRKDRAHPTTCTEYMAECKQDTGPWQSHPARMLRHKAIIQAARIAFGFSLKDPDEAERIIEAHNADDRLAIEMPTVIDVPEEKQVDEDTKPAQPATAKPDDGDQVVIGTFDAVSTSHSKPGAGKEWTKWSVRLCGETLSTFSETIGAELEGLAGKPAAVYYKTDAKGYHNITAAVPDKGEAQDDAADPEELPY